MFVDCTTLANQNGWSKRELQTFHTAIIETINKGSNYMAVHFPSGTAANTKVIGNDNAPVLGKETAGTLTTGGASAGAAIDLSTYAGTDSSGAAKTGATGALGGLVHDRVINTGTGSTAKTLTSYKFVDTYIGSNWIISDQIVGQ